MTEEKSLLTPSLNQLANITVRQNENKHLESLKTNQDFPLMNRENQECMVVKSKRRPREGERTDPPKGKISNATLTPSVAEKQTSIFVSCLDPKTQPQQVLQFLKEQN